MNTKLNALRAHAGALLAAFLIVAAGCSDDADPVTPPAQTHTIVGAWQMATIIMYDTPVGELTIPAETFLKMSNTGATSSVLHFNEDGSAFVETTYAESPQDTITGSWTAQGDSLTVTGAGIDETVQFAVDENTLTLTRIMAINFVPNGPKQDIKLDMVYDRIK